MKTNNVLPKVGDIVYQTDGVRKYASKIEKIIYICKDITFDENAIGTSIFLTQDEIPNNEQLLGQTSIFDE